MCAEKESSKIYTVILRGGGAEKFYSGPGSHTDSYVSPYCELIKTFLTEHPDVKHVVDFGCGDFNVASKFISDKINYTGVDIVKEMIISHQKNFASEHVNFMCLDIVDDALPDGDMCLIRQVLQHLSNDDITKVLAKLKKYRYSMITEHVTPKAKATALNADILTGPHNRINFLSGVYLDEAPFSLECEIVLRIPYDDDGSSELVTYLVKN
ncbi:MAG: class I SAM-dependent methyltransferase [Synergistaceae bacterium]|nr:class I SAM-dependent methyltransferase [Synergistaceae bacterium]